VCSLLLLHMQSLHHACVTGLGASYGAGSLSGSGWGSSDALDRVGPQRMCRPAVKAAVTAQAVKVPVAAVLSARGLISCAAQCHGQLLHTAERPFVSDPAGPCSCSIVLSGLTLEQAPQCSLIIVPAYLVHRPDDALGLVPVKPCLQQIEEAKANHALLPPSHPLTQVGAGVYHHNMEAGLSSGSCIGVACMHATSQGHDKPRMPCRRQPVAPVRPC
jgi:hypothetical protein